MSRRRVGGPDGVLRVDKPAGPTSAEVVDWVRWALRGQAVGHCGTLDPDATGLLVVCVGAATKLAAVLTDADKTYRATFVFGRSTTTADAAGDTVAQAPCPGGLADAFGQAVAGLVGALELSPPAFSAVKVDGRRAHELARDGQAPALAARTMVVREVSGVAIEGRGPDEVRAAATLRVSKGTYIRSLAEELGRRLGAPAHLGALRRTGAAPLGVEGALGDFDVQPRDPDPRGKPRHRLRLRGVPGDREGQAGAIHAALVDPLDAVPLPRIAVPADADGADLLRRLSHGQPVPATHPALPPATDLGPVAVVARSPRALFLARWREGAQGALLHPQRVVIAP